MSSEALQILRETFSEARSAKQEQFYGLHTQVYTKAHTARCDIRWRNHCTGEEGSITTVPKALMLDTLTALLNELQRLRGLRRIHLAKKEAA